MGKNDLLDKVEKESKVSKTIPQIGGANIRVEDVEDLKVKSTEVLINVDTTEEEVLELIEGFEKVDIIFPPKVFLKLSEGVFNKLSFESKEKYFVAKREYEATERDRVNKEKDPNYGLITMIGGDVSHKMVITDEDRKNAKGKHIAILNGYEVSAEGSAYVKLPGSEPIRNTNPATMKEEVLVKCTIEEDRYRGHMKAASDLSKDRIKNQKLAKRESTLEIVRDTVGTKIYGG